MYELKKDELQFRLETFGKAALELAKKVPAPDGSSPLDTQEKSIMEAIKYSVIRGILNEAGIFAILGHTKDMEYAFEQVAAWAQYRF